MSRGSLLWILPSALLLASCSPKTTGVLLDANATTASQLTRLVEQRSEMVRSLKGEGTISFDTPEISGSAWFTSMMKRPDSLLVEVEGPLGIGGGTFFLSRERYVMYNSIENKVITGDPGDGTIRSVMPIDLTYDQIVSAFAGIFTLPRETEAPLSYTIDDDRFFLSYTCGSNVCEYWIDPSYLLVTRFRQRTADGQVLLEATCSSLTEDDGAAAPRKIVVRFPAQDRRLAIAYSSMTLNTADVSFLYSIPKNARTVVR